MDGRPPSARVQLSPGLWLTLRAARLGSDIAVTIEESTPAEKLDLFARACALAPRETELLAHLVSGADTRAVAGRMVRSEHTVQDHLKSVFAKTRTHSRRRSWPGRSRLTAYRLFERPIRGSMNGMVPAGPSEPDPAALWRLTRLLVEAVARSLAAAEGALAPAPGGRSAVDVLVGAAAVAGQLAGRMTRPLTRVLGALPLPAGLAERGRRERAAAAVDLERLATALVPAVTAAVLDRLDLTALVRDRVELDALVAQVDADAVVARVDLDAIAARLDVDAIARRIDLDAIVDRLDLVGLANRTVDGIDLSELIRDSTGSVTHDMVRGVRIQGVQADRAVAGFVARLLRRDTGPVPT